MHEENLTPDGDGGQGLYPWQLLLESDAAAALRAQLDLMRDAQARAREALTEVLAPVREATRQLGPAFGDMARRWAEFYQSNHPGADYARLLLPRGCSEHERQAAADRILARLGPPVASHRWSADPIGFRTAQEDVGDARELARQRIYEAAGVLWRWSPSSLVHKSEKADEEVRARLRALIAEDLRGPGWRDKTTRGHLLEQELEPGHEDPLAMFEAVERVALLDSLVGTLNPRDRELIALERENLTTREIADRLSSTEVGIRKRRQRVIERLVLAAQARLRQDTPSM